jgi:hypothetical protein
LSGSGLYGRANGAFVNDGSKKAAGVIGNFDVGKHGYTATGIYGGTRP